MRRPVNGDIFELERKEPVRVGGRLPEADIYEI
jgi:hypothetical protein